MIPVAAPVSLVTAFIPAAPVLVTLVPAYFISATFVFVFTVARFILTRFDKVNGAMG